MAIHGGRNLPKTSAEPLLLETNMQPAVWEAVPPPAESKRKGALGVSGERAVAGRALPLHIAASSGDVKQMAACILSQRSKAKSKALLDGGDHRQYTPFHMACAGGHVDCVRLLLDAGCDTALRNDEGLTGWELAAQLQRIDVLALQQQQEQQQQEEEGEKLTAKGVEEQRSQGVHSSKQKISVVGTAESSPPEPAPAATAAGPSMMM